MQPVDEDRFKDEGAIYKVTEGCAKVGETETSLLKRRFLYLNFIPTNFSTENLCHKKES